MLLGETVKKGLEEGGGPDRGQVGFCQPDYFQVNVCLENIGGVESKLLRGEWIVGDVELHKIEELRERFREDFQAAAVDPQDSELQQVRKDQGAEKEAIMGRNLERQVGFDVGKQGI